MTEEIQQPAVATATVTNTMPSMGITGLAATIANTSAVALLAALYVYEVTYVRPREHEIVAEQREFDRTAHAAEIKMLVQKGDEREERIKAREDERMKRLWERQAILSSDVADIKQELRKRP